VKQKDEAFCYILFFQHSLGHKIKPVLQTSLFRSVDIHALVFFRIAFGILGFADVAGTWGYKHLYMGSFHPDGFQFKYYGFEWVAPLPEPFMTIFFLLLMGAAIGIALGWRYRACCWFFAFGFLYVFLLEKAYYLNHAYLFATIAFVMPFLPAQRAWSADVLRRPQISLRKIPWWPLLLLQFMMGVVYFYGGIAKINPDWLNALPLKLWLRDKSNMPLLGGLWAQEWVAYLMSYGGLLLDLLVVFFLIFRRTRWWALGFVLFFHLTNLILFKIGIFPFLSTTLTLLFFPPDFPRSLYRWLCLRFPRLKRINEWWIKKESIASEGISSSPISYTPTQQKRIIALLSLFAFIQLTIPLRHHYFADDVAWTEEGHRYAWRMMLRSKQGYGSFFVQTKGYPKREKINIVDHLKDKRQRRKLYTHPDMILQFAHYLRDHYRQQGEEEVEVYADIRVRLNGRKYQPYVNPDVDLAKEEWSFLEEADWLVRVEEE